MAGVRDWLQLFRSHTSPLEMTITTVAAALAVGTIWDVKVLLFLIFGWLYHNGGYGHNSVEDYISGHDVDDRNKAHHPLQRGVIGPHLGRKVTLGLIAISFLYGVVISANDPTAIIFLVLLTSLGFVYNVFNKRMSGKFLPIMLAHSFLFPFAYLGAGGDINVISSFPFTDSLLMGAAVLATLYLILQIAYQIMIEGDLKDIDMDEASLLGSLGVSVEGGTFKASISARFISFKLKFISIGTLFAIVYLLDGGIAHYLVLGGFTVLLLLFDHRLMRKREWDHGECLKTMAMMEVFSTFSLVAALTAGIGNWVASIVIMTFNIGYFVLMNRFLWGTLIKPKV